MQELYSKDEDCFELYKILKQKMGNKIDYYGTPYNALFSGKYFSHYRKPHSNIDYLFESGLPFYFKFCKNGFLRISVGSNIEKNTTVGEKLAALSNFYRILVEIYGNPTVFYTTKEDDEVLFSLQWSFVNKEEEIAKFKNDSYFDDASIDKLIIIDEKPNESLGYNLKDETKQIISQQVGLPFELLPLIDENIEDYLMYTKGKKIGIPKGAKTDCLPVTSFEEKAKTRTLSKNIFNQ